LIVPRIPFGFAHDRSRTCLGDGELGFAAAVRAFERWVEFDLGWIRVANPSAEIRVGQIVAVEARALGLWSLNLSEIVDVARTATCFGFLYKTTPHHVEEGEERFVLTQEPETGAVWFELEAVSRPRSALARLGFPYTRACQHRFARESHWQMREATRGGTA
jgi:uncharacterized protein (UPF0548 family)